MHFFCFYVFFISNKESATVHNLFLDRDQQVFWHILSEQNLRIKNFSKILRFSGSINWKQAPKMKLEYNATDELLQCFRYCVLVDTVTFSDIFFRRKFSDFFKRFISLSIPWPYNVTGRQLVFWKRFASGLNAWLYGYDFCSASKSWQKKSATNYLVVTGRLSISFFLQTWATNLK